MKKLLIPKLLQDYKTRTSKFQELGPEKYNEWIEERNQATKKEFLEKNPDLLKEGQFRRENKSTFAPSYPKKETAEEVQDIEQMLKETTISTDK